MNRTFATLLAVIVGFVCQSFHATAAEQVLPPESHPWAAFPPGVWKVVRVKSDTLDDTGRVVKTSVTETKTTLREVNQNAYELLVDVTVEVDGKRFAADPRTVRQGFYGELPGEKVSIVPLRNETYRLGELNLPVNCARVEFAEKDQRRVTTVYFSESCRSHLLRRESDLFDSAGTLLCRSTTDTISLDCTFDLLGKRCCGWNRRTEQHSPQGKVILEETHCAEIPGGVVSHTCQEFDDSGRLIRRSTLETTSYSTIPLEFPPRRKLFQRRRAMREEATEQRP